MIRVELGLVIQLRNQLDICDGTFLPLFDAFSKRSLHRAGHSSLFTASEVGFIVCQNQYILQRFPTLNADVYAIS